MWDRENILPTSLPPRGLSRVQAAAYRVCPHCLIILWTTAGATPTRKCSRLWIGYSFDELSLAWFPKKSSAACPRIRQPRARTSE